MDKNKSKKQQRKKFVEAARRLDCDLDEAHFTNKLKRLHLEKDDEQKEEKPDRK